LANGANPNARDRGRGSTPLRRAVSSSGAGGTAGTNALMVPLTRLLLSHGADPEARDKSGVTVRASVRAPELRAVFAEHLPTKQTSNSKGPRKSVKAHRR